MRVTRCSPESTNGAASDTHTLSGTHQDEGADDIKGLQLCSGEFHLFLLEKKDKSYRAQGTFGQLSQGQGGIIGVFYAEPGAGLSDDCGSLPGQDVPWSHEICALTRSSG